MMVNYLLALFICLSIPSVRARCSSSQFECDNGHCIPLGWKCDREPDCEDNSDELMCPKKECTADQYTCDNDQCITSRWQCDGEDDCGDNSDEKPDQCSHHSCGPNQFPCGKSGNCIPDSWRCDDSIDCTDGEDELGCAPTSCSEDEFSCNNTKCISARWKCDSENDCGDGSDEIGCAPRTCPPNNFMCDEKLCIPMHWQCDGDMDCNDGTDEHGTECQDNDPTENHCHDQDFMCKNKKCIHSSWRCDGDPDCTDGSDEDGCTEGQTCEANEFLCHDGSVCIPGNLQCDDQADCDDGSDEIGCVYDRKCDVTKEFNCNIGSTTGNCIPLEKLCDHINDCGQNEDEDWSRTGVCNKTNPCHHTDNGGCSQNCHFTHSGHYCTCQSGFELQDDSKTCEDINECDQFPPVCSQECFNSKGSYKCDCFNGYYMDPHGHYCKAAGPKGAKIFFANRHDLREISMDTGEYRTVLKETKSAIAIDFDYKSNLLFFSDVAYERIFMASLSGPVDATPVPIVNSSVSTPDGIAFDWIHQNLYWTDTGLDTISVISIGTNHKVRKTLLTTGFDEPRAIVVDPRENQGWMYWSDWGQEPKIMRAGLDGSHATTLVADDDLQWPNGLTIDYVSNRLFWLDAKLHLIASCALDGSKRMVVVTDNTNLLHPFAISVFEDFLYWTDWETESIHKTHKFQGGAIEHVAISLFSPMDIQIIHQYKQPNAPNVCGTNNGGCSHLCLPSPQFTENSAKYQCACPDKLHLGHDGKSCTNDDGDVVTRPHHIIPITKSPNNGEVSYKPEQPGGYKPVQPGGGVTDSSSNAVGQGGSDKVSILDNRDIGKIAAIVVGILLGMVLIGIVVGCVMYRSYIKKAVKSMNFDNPVYRKTTEDQFSLEKNQYQPSSKVAQPSTLEPLNSPGSEIV